MLRYSETMGVTSVVMYMVNCCAVLTRLGPIFDVEKLTETGRLDDVIAAAAALGLQRA